MTYSYTGEGINPWDERATDWVRSTEIGNFESSGWASTGEVAGYLRETIPPTHLEGCSHIQYESNPSELYPNARGIFDSQSREINVWTPSEQLQGMEDTVEPLTHQVGYNAYENIRANRPDSAEQWSELHNRSLTQYTQDGSGFVSDRASTDEREDFAETYTTYIHDPEKLQSYSPEKYEFMKQEIFSGREYPRPTLGNITYDHVRQKISFGRRIPSLLSAVRELPVVLERVTEMLPELLKNPKFVNTLIGNGLEATENNVLKMLDNPETRGILAKLSKPFL